MSTCVVAAVADDLAAEPQAHALRLRVRQPRRGRVVVERFLDVPDDVAEALRVEGRDAVAVISDQGVVESQHVESWMKVHIWVRRRDDQTETRVPYRRGV